MARIEYTKTKFNRPRIPSEGEYIKLKELYFNNPNFKLFEENETFTEHFSQKFKLMGIGIVVALVCFSIGETGSIILLFGLIAIPVTAFSFISLILEGPTYASFLKDKENYEYNLRKSVLKSTSYENFAKMYDNI
jgi:hypothetical protein